MTGTSRTGDSYVIAIGAAAVDEYYDAREWPREGAKELVEYREDLIGGMIPNAACVFAGYGVRTYLVDTLKRGSRKTEQIVENLKRYGIRTELLRYADGIPDARTMIVLTPGERTILVVDPKKPMLEIREEELELFRNAAYLYTTPLELLNLKDPMAFTDDLKDHGVRLAFDVEASTVEGCGRELIRKADVLFFNEFGFERIREERGEEETLAELFESGVKIVTITMGERGSRTVTPGEDFRVEGMKLEVVDTTGAGDTFNSTFLTCLLLGRSLKEAARFANAAGGYSVTRLGPKGGVNDLEFIEDLVKRCDT